MKYEAEDSRGGSVKGKRWDQEVRRGGGGEWGLREKEEVVLPKF